MVIHGAQDCIFWFRFKWCPSLEFAKKHLKPSGNLQKQKKGTVLFLDVGRCCTACECKKSILSGAGRRVALVQTRSNKGRQARETFTQSSLQIFRRPLEPFVLCCMFSPKQPQPDESSQEHLTKTSEDFHQGSTVLGPGPVCTTRNPRISSSKMWTTSDVT